MPLELPLQLWLGPLPVHPHLVFDLLAYLVGGRIYALLKRRQGDVLAPGERWSVVAAGFVGAALGGKVLPWLAHPGLTLAHWSDPFYLLAGKSIVGALVGALVAVEWTKRRIGVSRATGDLFAIPLTVGIAVGRVGCFLSGLDDNTHGLPASLPWAVDYGDGIPRHPAQLYEIAFLLLGLLPLLLWVGRRRHREGDLFKLFMVGYLGFRLGLEFLKPGDPILGLNGIQWLCLATLLWYVRELPGLVRVREKEFLRGCHRIRPYLFYDVAVSICSTCYRKVEGKIVFQDDRVFLLKACPLHGGERVLLADDVDYYRRCREVFIKPAEMPLVFNTPVKWGCPYDCGLCSDHQQHSCLTLVELTDSCNLHCPICYADSGPARQTFRSLAEIERMLDAVVRNEGEPDVVQLSGGEPTLHPDFFAVLDAARRRPIKHLMLNTNGLRIAQDQRFAERLAEYRDGFEVYLQFDSLEEAPLRELRGADLRAVRAQALARLNQLDLATTLVVTVKRGANDGELGRIVEFALQQRCVRGVTFQPIQAAGRLEGFDTARHRLTLTEVRRRILEQTSVFQAEDIIPVPCHPDSLAMAYALKLNGQVVPLTGLMDPRVLIDGGRNTVLLERDDAIREAVFSLFSTNHSPEAQAGRLRDLLCCLPQVAVPRGLGYANVFRLMIVQFIDAYAFDVRSVKKTCIHIVHPDGRLIPFDTYNLFYRDDLERTRLDPLRRRVEEVTSFE